MKRKNILIFIITLGFLLSLVLYRLVDWTIINFADLTFEKVVFHLRVPLEGTDSNFVSSAIEYSLFPNLRITLLLLIALLIYENGRKSIFISAKIKGYPVKKSEYKLRLWPVPFMKRTVVVATIFMIGASIMKADKSLALFSYIKSQLNQSTFIEENYVAPSKAGISFPKEKRNLIMIYLESMENTYFDINSGGAFPDNYIPELKSLADENISFSNTELSGGSFPIYGTQWTMAAMFSTSTGLPLKLPIDGNAMSDHKSFIPGVVSLGDILEDNGYKNYLLLGSQAEFGGRELFYKQHGDYEIFDYITAKEDGLIPEDYREWWGFEDQKLFSFAKDKLLEISMNDDPFNLTLLTADTHHQDGYVCPLCKDEFETQYANVLACSSRQVYEFVDWIKQQEYYKDTSIVIVGDHPTMDSDFCLDVPKDYKRTIYNSFINAKPVASTYRINNIHFSPYDIFPTTLASLGVEVEGNQLGLGVNLFSGQETLLEKFPDINVQLSPRSIFYEKQFIFSTQSGVN